MPKPKPTQEHRHFPLTQASIARLQPPAAGQETWYDTVQPGLSIRISAGGTKTFEVFKRILGGGPVRVKLGRFPNMNVKTARDEARDRINELKKGINPNEVRQQEQEAADRDITFDTFFNEYVKRHAKPHTRGGAEKAQRTYGLHLKPWAKRKLSSITYRDVQDLHSRIACPKPVRKKDGKPSKKPVGGPRAANLTVALLSHMFNKARAWGHHEGDNPARGIEKFPDSPRERWLRGDEVEKFFDALTSEPSDSMRAIFTVMLLTGQRKGNVIAMRWEHVHLDRATWEIPGTETKAGNRIEVPLHEHVMALLRQREAARKGENPWVFPGSGKTGHVQEIKKVWRELLTRAGLTDLRPHDLRHTYASWQVASGVHLRVISKSLGHKSPLTVNRYAHVDVEPVRQAMQKAGDALLVAGGVKQPAEVVPLRKPAKAKGNRRV